ncbi:MAG: NAD(+)/NADH kinase [Chloroflexota bacterium]
MLQRVAVLFHPRRRQAVVEAEWLSAELDHRGVSTELGSGWDSDVVERLCCECQLAVVLGGDGTIIRVARLASPIGVPVLGVNLGRVGFLAEMTPRVLHESVDALAEGRFWVETRSMLDVFCMIAGQNLHFSCLNEVVVARGAAPRAIHVNTTLDGEDLMTYTADAVLVATATGSTAYSLAAGGPILYPESRDFVITPVAPHLHIGRSMVVASDTTVRLTLATDRPAIVSVDGTDEHPLHPGDWVDVCRGNLVARFARLGPRKYFYAAIADRLK